MLISKLIFKKIKKYIILIYFKIKNTLKNNRYYTLKYSNILKIDPIKQLDYK